MQPPTINGGRATTAWTAALLLTFIAAWATPVSPNAYSSNRERSHNARALRADHA